jgi:flagellar hook-length control protein FliK
MSTNTQNNIRTNNNVQTNSLKINKSNKQEANIDFSALFSEAMGNTTPKAQLNALESQMRQALSKTEEKKKTPESNPMAAENAQSLVWSQRNWNTQSSHQPEGTNHAISNSSNPTPATSNNVEPKNKQGATEAKQQTSEKPTEQPAEKTNAQAKPQNNASSNKESTATERPSQEAIANNAQATEDIRPVKDTSVDLRSNNNANNTVQIQTQADTNITSQAVKDPSAPVELKGNAQTTPNINPALTQQVNAQSNNAMVAEEESIQTVKAGDLKLTTAGQSAAALGASTSNVSKSVGSPTDIKTPVTQPGFAKELGQTVQWALGKNMSTVDIRINPESFGPMNMRLVQKGQDVQIIIRTQDENSANLMTQAISGLKESMAQNGLQLSQVQIQHSGNTQSNNLTSGQQQQQWAQNQGQGGQQQNNAQNHRGGNSSGPQEDTPAPTTAQNTGNAGRGIDLFA